MLATKPSHWLDGMSPAMGSASGPRMNRRAVAATSPARLRGGLSCTQLPGIAVISNNTRGARGH
jgi:hypothetical protein